MIDGTRTNNGSTGGTFRANGGVRIAERRLRLLVGMPINSQQLIRPSDTPTDAMVKFDWAESVDTALANRPELREQEWNIKRVELEYVAAKNFLLPRLDLLGRYRFRGFGQDYLGNDVDFSDNPDESSAVADLLSGKRQEFQVGAELSIPIGYRREFAAVRNTELRLSKERALFREQQRDVMLGLSNAIGELQRAFESKMASMNRLKSAEKLRDALEAVVDLKNAAPLDVKLEAQRRVADAKIQYYRAQVEYMLAIKNVHQERSTLLSYFNVSLAESASSPKAYNDAWRRESLRTRPMNYVCRDLVIARPNTPDQPVQIINAAEGIPLDGEPHNANHVHRTGYRTAKHATKCRGGERVSKWRRHERFANRERCDRVSRAPARRRNSDARQLFRQHPHAATVSKPHPERRSGVLTCFQHTTIWLISRQTLGVLDEQPGEKVAERREPSGLTMRASRWGAMVVEKVAERRSRPVALASTRRITGRLAPLRFNKHVCMHLSTVC